MPTTNSSAPRRHTIHDGERFVTFVNLENNDLRVVVQGKTPHDLTVFDVHADYREALAGWLTATLEMET